MAQPSFEEKGEVKGYYSDGRHGNEHGLEVVGTDILGALVHVPSDDEDSLPEMYGMVCP